ncbi:MAG: hypothetical protein K2K73_02615, partial [Ureaplasma sp.]|nr:hypothetical protein [Ureaplasma sp.]
MALIIISFIVIIITLLLSVLGSWLFNYSSIKHSYLSYKDLDVNLIKKYNLINYSAIDKKSIWLNFSIWNILIYLFDYSLLLFSFLILKQENNQLFISSLILIIVANNLCLFINFLIAYFLYKKYYLNKQEYIQHNILE